MGFFFGPNGVNYATLPREQFELVPMFCDYEPCSRPIGRAALWLVQMWQKPFCSKWCELMAEWHAPEHR